MITLDYSDFLRNTKHLNYVKYMCVTSPANAASQWNNLRVCVPKDNDD